MVPGSVFRKMKMVTIYGIKNCDTMKKTFAWLEEHKITFMFHDYKKQGVDEAVLKEALKAHGWEEVLNRRGTTWRNPPDAVKNAMDQDTALTVALENPSIIKRPLLVYNAQSHLGFKPDVYEGIFVE